MLGKVCGSSDSQQKSCQKCNNEQANGYCQQCSKLLCQTCINKHDEWITDHQILGIEDVATTASRRVPLKKQPTMKCSSHEKELEVYCDTCDKLICLLCTAATAHHGHKYEPLTDAFPRHKKQIVDCLDLVKKKLVAITAAVQAVKTHEECFLKQVGTVRKEIEATVQQLIQLLEQSEKRLIAELEQVTDAYVEKISARKKEADLLIAQLRSCEEFAEEELRIGSQQEIMVMKKHMAERMQAVCFQVVEDKLRPLEETSVTFAISASVLDACRNLGSMVRLGHVEVACNKTTFDLFSAAPLSSELVSCQFSSVADPTAVVKCAIHQVAPGRFEIHHPPPTIDLGLHQLSVQMSGIDILDQPLKMMPRKPKEKFTLSGSAGIVVTNNFAIVAECHKHCITVLNVTNGEKIVSFGEKGNGPKQFKSPIGVAVNKAGELIVADHENHRLQVLKLPSVDQHEVQLVCSIGSKGSQPLQFCHPTDVAVHHNNKIYVVDSGNNRIQVLNADYTYSHCFGSNGAQPGEFVKPQRIVCDADGMIYISDYGNNRVQKLTPEGNPLAIINSKGNGGPLSSPCGLCVVDGNDILYVTELATEKAVKKKVQEPVSSSSPMSGQETVAAPVSSPSSAAEASSALMADLLKSEGAKTSAPLAQTQEHELTSDRKAILVNLEEMFGFHRQLILLAFERCDSPADKNEVSRWCLENQDKYKYEDEDKDEEDDEPMEEEDTQDMNNDKEVGTNAVSFMDVTADGAPLPSAEVVVKERVAVDEHHAEKNMCVFSTTTQQFLGYFDCSEKFINTFKHPWFVTSDNAGRMYVSDCDKHQVVVY